MRAGRWWDTPGPPWTVVVVVGTYGLSGVHPLPSLPSLILFATCTAMLHRIRTTPNPAVGFSPALAPKQLQRLTFERTGSRQWSACEMVSMRRAISSAGMANSCATWAC